ncbi:MAG: TIGR03013 family PEP-CTERM/XrtA system glycosyltransferase [Rhodoferax sp.]|uniref:TIGR03013 family XrtA/PEP-CTERM system glycosyltransferase n=1 Tax=Rhodoferax sp. TaxID=50421 RepID=UPI0017F8FE2B|nr:TIGR03013 family XrtA/PEP-CTERM system glycosyltransferase [Rhodoferax sp.]NMM15525.1 TIGR03013 family PEP-CTERM/XrtA system glycosyltransferase [Rhodoferax sp.]NMM21322.1 TIGR03013 family PEP-CTERM/XrtA system glycosyltransferase [Rhodoferax sp.]
MIKIFNHYFHKRTLLQIFFDLGFVVVTVMVAILMQVADPSSVSSLVVTTTLLLAVGILVINAGLGFYQRVHHRTVGQTRARAVLSLCLSMSLAYGIFRLSPLPLADASAFVLALVAAVALMLVHRIYVAHAMPRAMMRQRVLIFGSGDRARLVGRTLKNSDPNVDLVGYYASPNETTSDISGWGLLSPKKSLTDIVIEEQVDEIVVALSERRGGSMPLRELLDCKLHGVRVVDIATHFEKTMGQIRRDSVSAGWLIFGDGFEQGLIRTMVKRLFDIVCATLLIVLALPVMVMTSILILLESAGSIFYLQERVGLNGRLFNVVKFRSMRTDAEKDGQPRWASTADERITRVGRVIRKLRIDELPQLFSVLGGDMSLVGPRPERPYFVDKLTQELPYYAVRQSVKPGITGWAQVRYHYGASVEDSAEKLQYDLYYVKNHTLFLDLIVLFETVGVVLMGKGA